jgi:tripeptide aminopeptidase
MTSSVQPSQARVLDLFERLLPIANPSGGESAMRGFIQQELTRLGLNDQRVDEPGNLFVHVPGRSDRPGLLLSAHMDSVPPCEGIEAVRDVDPQTGREILRSVGKTILGADDRAGIAVILALMERFAAEGFTNNCPLELLFSTQEERGLIGLQQFQHGRIRSVAGLALDGEGNVGDIFHAGPGQLHYSITVCGQAGHSGIMPDYGVNAIQVAAALCAQLPTGRLSPGMTANIALIEGGSAINVIPDRVVLRGEARSLDPQNLPGFCQQIEALCRTAEERSPGSRVIFEFQHRYSSFSVHTDSPIVRHTIAACNALQIPANVKAMGIGSDAHVLNQRGLPSLVLGMGFFRSHSLGEYLFTDQLIRAVDWVDWLVRHPMPPS